MHENSRDHKQLTQSSSDRSFGLVFTVFFMIVALLPMWHGHSARIWAGWTAIIFLVCAIFVPSILAPLNRLWTRFGELLHGIVSPLMLAILFFGAVAPIGIVMRLSGKKLLHLDFDRAALSYWMERNPPGPDAESLRDQF